jgi:hypothetical protein
LSAFGFKGPIQSSLKLLFTYPVLERLATVDENDWDFVPKRLQQLRILFDIGFDELKGDPALHSPDNLFGLLAERAIWLGVDLYSHVADSETRGLI